jgi:hypothetical protein
LHQKSVAAGAALAAVVATLAIAGTQPAAALAPAITIATSDTGALEVLADASALWVRAPVHDDADTVLARTDDLTYDSTQYWHTGSVAGSSACSFSVTGYGATDGYYRIARPESDNVLAFVSGRLRLHRISTRFGSLSISPTRPCPNRRMTFTGSVTPTVRQQVDQVQSRTRGPRVPAEGRHLLVLGREGLDELLRSKLTQGAVRLAAWGYADGYYRLYQPMSDELSHTSTTPLHLSRIVTRVYGNNAGPEPVKTGGTESVNGTPQEYRSGWRAMAHPARPAVLARQGREVVDVRGVGQHRLARQSAVAGQGDQGGWWLLQYWGDSKHFDSEGTSDYVDAR